MWIKKAYCFFEQSGTFRDAFKANGIDAADYDIDNLFGTTDVVCDLFAEIEKGYTHQPSIFDGITPSDLIFAFFPCTYFCENNDLYFRGDANVLRKYSKLEQLNIIIDRAAARQKNYDLLLKFVSIAVERGLRLIIENPYSVHHYLYNNFPVRPSIIDRNRAAHGDNFTKPTQYFCINFTPSRQRSFLPRRTKLVQRAMSGRTHEDRIKRSLITPQYADLFIKDCILGIIHPLTEPTLF